MNRINYVRIKIYSDLFLINKETLLSSEGNYLGIMLIKDNYRELSGILHGIESFERSDTRGLVSFIIVE